MTITKQMSNLMPDHHFLYTATGYWFKDVKVAGDFGFAGFGLSSPGGGVDAILGAERIGWEEFGGYTGALRWRNHTPPGEGRTVIRFKFGGERCSFSPDCEQEPKDRYEGDEYNCVMALHGNPFVGVASCRKYSVDRSFAGDR